MKNTLLKILSSQIVSYHSDIARALDSTSAALLLSQFLYWHGKGADKEWFYKTRSDLMNETGMKRSEQQTARKILIKFKIIDEKLKGNPATMHYKINFDALINKMKKYYEEVEDKKKEKEEEKKGKEKNSVGHNVANKMAEKCPTRWSQSDILSLHKNTTKEYTLKEPKNKDTIYERIIKNYNLITNSTIKLTDERKRLLKQTLLEYSYKDIIYSIHNLNKDHWSQENKQIRLERLIMKTKRDSNLDKFGHFPFRRKFKQVKYDDIDQINKVFVARGL